MKAVRIEVSGKVQGVYFRHYAREMAIEFGIKGIVKNLPDGNVEIIAEGDESGIQKFTTWCHNGPVFAKVVEVWISEIEFQGYQKFEIIR